MKQKRRLWWQTILTLAGVVIFVYGVVLFRGGIHTDGYSIMAAGSMLTMIGLVSVATARRFN